MWFEVRIKFFNKDDAVRFANLLTALLDVVGSISSIEFFNWDD